MAQLELAALNGLSAFNAPTAAKTTGAAAAVWRYGLCFIAWLTATHAMAPPPWRRVREQGPLLLFTRYTVMPMNGMNEFCP